jgi:hypothetical protein
MIITLPGVSAQYGAARDRLLEREIALRREMEAVAAARRELPPGGVVSEDYVFQAAGPVAVRMSELFAPSTDALIIYSLMFPRDPGDERPGPASGETAPRQATVPVVRRPARPARRARRARRAEPQPRERRQGTARAPARVRVTSGRSNHSGTSSTSRARAGPTGTSS